MFFAFSGGMDSKTGNSGAVSQKGVILVFSDDVVLNSAQLNRSYVSIALRGQKARVHRNSVGFLGHTLPCLTRASTDKRRDRSAESKHS